MAPVHFCNNSSYAVESDITFRLYTPYFKRNSWDMVIHRDTMIRKTDTHAMIDKLEHELGALEFNRAV